MDRINKAGGTDLGYKLLAHVLVHEITHILQGTDRHSPNGIMKSHWKSEDLLQMASGPLPFDQHDLKLIHEGLAARASVCKQGWSPRVRLTKVVPERYSGR